MLQTSNAKKVLKYVRSNPGCTSPQVIAALGPDVTPLKVTSLLWSMWKGRYITRKKSGVVGRGPVFAYYFHTEKPRRKKGTVKKRKAGGSKVVKPMVAKVQPAWAGPPEKIWPDLSGSNGVEILVAVTGTKETLTLTPSQVRALYASLKDLLGM